MTTRGRFIVFEGGEGAGKTSHARAVREALEARGRRVIQTREPGGSPLAEAVRDLVLGDWAEGIDPVTELLLIFAARAAHLHATIRPALEAGTDVICDRFVDASYAYQGAGRGLPDARIAELERLVLGEFRPDLVVVLDLDPRIGLARIGDRGGNNRFDAENLDFMQRVRATYLARAAQDPAGHVVIDAGRSFAAVHEDLLALIEMRFGAGS